MTETKNNEAQKLYEVLPASYQKLAVPLINLICDMVIGIAIASQMKPDGSQEVQYNTKRQKCQGGSLCLKRKSVERN